MVTSTQYSWWLELNQSPLVTIDETGMSVPTTVLVGSFTADVVTHSGL
ncbi:hypothetical protein [Streptacidiphilus sp. MAP5-3]